VKQGKQHNSSLFTIVAVEDCIDPHEWTCFDFQFVTFFIPIQVDRILTVFMLVLLEQLNQSLVDNRRLNTETYKSSNTASGSDRRLVVYPFIQPDEEVSWKQ